MDLLLTQDDIPDDHKRKLRYENARKELTRITGEDFGDDVMRWFEWLTTKTDSFKLPEDSVRELLSKRTL